MTCRRGDGVRTPLTNLLRLRFRKFRLALHGVALLGLRVDGLPEGVELFLEGGDLLLREE